MNVNECERSAVLNIIIVVLYYYHNYKEVGFSLEHTV